MKDLRNCILIPLTVSSSATPKGGLPPRRFHRLRKLRALSLTLGRQRHRRRRRRRRRSRSVGQTLPGVDKDLGQEGFALKAISFCNQKIHKCKKNIRKTDEGVKEALSSMSSHGCCCRNEWPFRGPQVPFKSPKRISLRRSARNLGVYTKREQSASQEDN